jgi:hypothetical protein
MIIPLENVISINVNELNNMEILFHNFSPVIANGPREPDQYVYVRPSMTVIIDQGQIIIEE